MVTTESARLLSSETGRKWRNPDTVEAGACLESYPRWTSGVLSHEGLQHSRALRPDVLCHLLLGRPLQHMGQA